MAWGRGWRPYVPVWKRRQQAERQMDKLRRKGLVVQPVEIDGRTIARTFWGMTWCEHLEKFSDFENRLPRGRTYVRNGSVCHLEIHKGKIAAKVSGSSLYDVKVAIKTLPKAKWQRIRKVCAGRVGSMLELLQGRLSSQVMSVVTARNDGLLPLPEEMGFVCSCPDWADLCKHVAAVLYGVGARLDNSPELLFLLRGVNHSEMVSADAAKAVVAKGPVGKGRMLDRESLPDVFGIELSDGKRKQGGRHRKTSAKATCDPVAPSHAHPKAERRTQRRRKGEGRRS